MSIILSLIMIISTYLYCRYVLLSENETINSLSLPSLVLLALCSTYNITEPPNEFSLFCLGILILTPFTVTHIYEKNTVGK